MRSNSLHLHPPSLISHVVLLFVPKAEVEAEMDVFVKTVSKTEVHDVNASVRVIASTQNSTNLKRVKDISAQFA